mmetsp:Transcript_4984/g.15132  ORF Transcript_4984/g.15132 Transcript_4984/m.15132 type:complete len:442 (-) Transcript_4984:269-1594(-)
MARAEAAPAPTDDHADADTQIKVGADAINAHKLVLVTASSLFENRLTEQPAAAALNGGVEPPGYGAAVFREPEGYGGPPPPSAIVDEDNEDEAALPPAYTPLAIADSGRYDEKADNELTMVRLADAARLTSRGVRNVIEWMYTGDCTSLPGRVSAAELERRGAAVAERKFVGTADQEVILRETTAAAEALGCNELVTFIQNIRDGLHVLNVSFGTYVMDRTANRAGRMLLGSERLADVTVELDDGTLIPAHATILSARCVFLRSKLRTAKGPDMLGRKRFRLPKLCAAVAMAILEFVYRDHVDFGSGTLATVDPIVLLQHAHAFGLKRLVTLCELQITKLVDRAVADSIRDADVDVIGLLNTASTHGATQLEAWCLHFVSTNYGPMSERKEWGNLTQRHRAHVETHQWPPTHYNEGVKKYEAELAVWEKKVGKKGHKGWFW